MNLFQDHKQNYKMTPKLKDLKYNKIESHFSVTFALFIDLMHSQKEINSITVSIEFLKVMIIHQIQSKRNDFRFVSV